MVATLVLLLVHVPPVVALISVVVFPWQTVVAPEMSEGKARTVTVVLDMQPDALVYCITAKPGLTPSNNPLDAPMVAMVGLRLAHVPPLRVLCNVVVALTQMVVVPVMGAAAFTVMIVLVKQPPGTV